METTFKKVKNKTHSRKEFFKWYHDNGATPELLVFRILEECDNNEHSLNLAEIKWFQSMNPKFYGKQPSLNDIWTHSEKTKLSISESVKNSLKNKNYFKICKKCDKEFYGKTPNACYCSDECRIANGVRSSSYKLSLKECINCNKPFRTKFFDKVLCNTCMVDLNEITKNCRVCKKEFSSFLANKIYCSKKCGNQAFKDSNPNYVIPKTTRFNVDKETLNRLYTIEKLSIKEICKIIGCKDQTVYTLLNKFSIPKRTRKDLTKK